MSGDESTKEIQAMIERQSNRLARGLKRAQQAGFIASDFMKKKTATKKKPTKRPNKQHVSHAASWIKFAQGLRSRAKQINLNSIVSAGLLIAASEAKKEGVRLRSILR